MSDSIIEDVKNEKYDWATQTILDTMKVKAEEAGKLKDNKDFITEMDTEAKQTTQEIWIATLQECSKPIEHAELKGLFRQKVLDWCAKHRK